MLFLTWKSPSRSGGHILNMEVIIGNYTQTREESILEEECWPLSLNLFLFVKPCVCIFVPYTKGSSKHVMIRLGH